MASFSLILTVSRYLVAVGNSPGSTTLSEFVSVGKHTNARINHLAASHGTTLYALVRGINVLGLYSDAVSPGVIVSSSPTLTVWDGLGLADIDYQQSESFMAASWRHTESCPLSAIYWAILRIDGEFVQPFSATSVTASDAVNENVDLVGASKYYVAVKIVNAIGLAIFERSDGVEIDSVPALPSPVFDGPDAGVDVNYQESVTTLQATWRRFGDPFSAAPGQQIDLYEVAAGTDVRYAVTRQNVVPFMSVGLNLSVTLTDLVLVPKIQQYFITVRAHSRTDAIIESSSTGVYVGYMDPPSRGSVSAGRFTNSSTTITATWSEFESELEILYYEWAISSFPVNITACPRNTDSYLMTLFDVQPFVNVGLNTLATRNDISLIHSGTYYVTVRATNEALKCSVVTSGPLSVDLTAPSAGDVTTGYDVGLENSFAVSSNELLVTWWNFEDYESDILSYGVSLLNVSSCGRDGNTSRHNSTTDVIDVGNATSYTFTELALQTSQVYQVAVRATNRAGSSTIVLSKPVVFVSSHLASGDVKDGLNWKEDVTFYSDLSRMYGTLAISRSPNQVQCPGRDYDFRETVSISGDWSVFQGDRLWDTPDYRRLSFKDSPAHVSATNDGVRLGLLRERGYRKVTSGAIYTDVKSIHDGSYVVDLKAAPGHGIVTSVVIWDGPDGSVGDFESTDVTVFGTDIEAGNSFASGLGSGDGDEVLADTLSRNDIERTENLTKAIPLGEGEKEYTRAFSGIGLQISGEKLSTPDSESFSYRLMFWCRFSEDSIEAKSIWIDLTFDPTDDYHSYRVDIRRTQVISESPVTAELFIDDEQKAVFVGVPQLTANATLAVIVRTVGGYVPPILDPFNLPSSYAFLARAQLPSLSPQLCHYGARFYDPQAKVSSLEACVSSHPSGNCDIVTFEDKARLCIPCKSPCDDFFCSPSCHDVNETVFTFEICNLSLSTEISSAQSVTEAEYEDFVEPAVYYFVVRATDVTGRSVTAVSNGIVIDVTPPVCDQVVQVDPSWSLTQPASYQGTNSSVAAYWECRDNVSGIVEYRWAITSNHGEVFDTQPFVSVGTEKSARRDGIPLKQKVTYFVIVQTVDRAGLDSWWYGQGITVDVEPPDVWNVSLEIPWTKNLTGKAVARVTPSTRQVGVKWRGLADDDIDLIGKQ